MSEQRAFAALDWNRIRHMTHPRTIGHPDSVPEVPTEYFYKFGLGLYCVNEANHAIYHLALDALDVDESVWARYGKYKISDYKLDKRDWNSPLCIDRNMNIVHRNTYENDTMILLGHELSTAEFFMLQYFQLLFTDSGKFVDNLSVSTVHAFSLLSHRTHEAMPDVEKEISFAMDATGLKWAYINRLSSKTDTDTLYWPRCAITLPDDIFSCEDVPDARQAWRRGNE